MPRWPKHSLRRAAAAVAPAFLEVGPLPRFAAANPAPWPAGTTRQLPCPLKPHDQLVGRGGSPFARPLVDPVRQHSKRICGQGHAHRLARTVKFVVRLVRQECLQTRAVGEANDYLTGGAEEHAAFDHAGDAVLATVAGPIQLHPFWADHGAAWSDLAMRDNTLEGELAERDGSVAPLSGFTGHIEQVRDPEEVGDVLGPRLLIHLVECPLGRLAPGS